LLELYREGLVAFEQAQALGELHVRWTGPTGEVDDAEAAALSAGAEWDEPLADPREEPVVGLKEDE
jgi:segregation and condensation protein A